MPNWVRNVMTLDGKFDDIMKALESVKQDDASLGTITFQKIVPRPEIEKTEWCGWARNNWGTKWDALQATEWPFTLKNRGDGTGVAELAFDTAWSTPFEALESFASQHPELYIAIVYSDELIPTNSGNYTFDTGKLCIDDRGYTDANRQNWAFRTAWGEEPFEDCDNCSWVNIKTGQNTEDLGEKCSTNLN